jgi:hypothetical protein
LAIEIHGLVYRPQEAVSTKVLEQESRAVVGSRFQVLNAIVDSARVVCNGQCPVTLADLAWKCAWVKVQRHEYEIRPTICQPVSLGIKITHDDTVRGIKSANQRSHVFLEITIGDKNDLKVVLAVSVQNDG